MSYIDGIYNGEEGKASANYAILQIYSNYSERVLKVAGITYVILSSTYLLYPIFLLIVYGEVYLPLRVYFPFIDENDQVGAVILLAFSLLLTLCLALLFCPFDIFFVNLFMSMRMVSSIATNNVREFEMVMLKRDCGDEIAAKSQLLHIILEHQKYNAWVLFVVLGTNEWENLQIWI